MTTSPSSNEKPFFRRGWQVVGWTVIRRIGSGGFGTVYEVEKNGERAALKTEFILDDKSESLRNEVKQLRMLQFSPHFCRLFLACKAEFEGSLINVMIMSLVGRSLSCLRRLMPSNKFTKNCSFRLAKQSLQAIQDMHSIGIIHRDIKASNFAWNPNDRRVYLLDLGFCRRFIYVTNEGNAFHRDARKSLPFMGTAKYCSLNVHCRREQSRRDDLWSWLYMFIEFVRGKLVWANRSEHMQATMKQHLGTRLMNGCPVEMVYIYDYIRMLEYNSRPDFAMMHYQLDVFLRARAVKEEDLYDFEPGGVHYAYMTEKMKKDIKTVRCSNNVHDQEPELTGFLSTKEITECTTEMTSEYTTEYE